MSNQTGHCLCGKLSYTFEGDPAMVALCHCDDCQRQSGSPYSINVGVGRAGFKLDGEPKVIHTTGTDTGEDRERLFCAECGSPIATMLAEMPDLAFIKGGTLDDRSVLQPGAELWMERRQDWLDGAGAERGEFARGLTA